jgi:hypothetical protein
MNTRFNGNDSAPVLEDAAPSLQEGLQTDTSDTTLEDLDFDDEDDATDPNFLFDEDDEDDDTDQTDLEDED